MNTELVTLGVGLLTLAGGQIATALVLVGRMDRQTERTDKRFDDVDKRFDDVNKRFDDVNKRFDDVNKRFDDVIREFADVRERMARLEGTVEGFVAGRARDAA